MHCFKIFPWCLSQIPEPNSLQKDVCTKTSSDFGDIFCSTSPLIKLGNVNKVATLPPFFGACQWQRRSDVSWLGEGGFGWYSQVSWLACAHMWRRPHNLLPLAGAVPVACLVGPCLPLLSSQRGRSTPNLHLPDPSCGLEPLEIWPPSAQIWQKWICDQNIYGNNLLWRLGKRWRVKVLRQQRGNKVATWPWISNTCDSIVVNTLLWEIA